VNDKGTKKNKIIKLWEFLLLLNTISFAFPSAVQDHVHSDI